MSIKVADIMEALVHNLYQQLKSLNRHMEERKENHKKSMDKLEIEHARMREEKVTLKRQIASSSSDVQTIY